MRKVIHHLGAQLLVFFFSVSFTQAQNQMKIVKPIIDFEITHFYQEKYLPNPHNQRLFRFMDKYLNEDAQFEDLKYSAENYLKRYCPTSVADEGSLLNQPEIEKLRKEYFKLSYKERYAVFHTLKKNENKKELLNHLYEDKLERFSFDPSFLAQDLSSLPQALEKYLAQIVEQFEADMANLMSAKEKDLWFARLIIMKYLHALESSYDTFNRSIPEGEKQYALPVSNERKNSTHERLI